MQLKDKVAFITGAASGIGHEIAVVFSREGANVVIADLNKEAADATAAEISKSGPKAIGIAVDVTSEEQVNAAVQTTVDTFGGIDILISNAGIQIVHPHEDFPFADWKNLLSIHLDGAAPGDSRWGIHHHRRRRTGCAVFCVISKPGTDRSR